MHIAAAGHVVYRRERTSLRLKRRLRMQQKSMAPAYYAVQYINPASRLEQEITDPDSPEIQDEFHAASSLLADLEAELETVRIPLVLN